MQSVSMLIWNLCIKELYIRCRILTSATYRERGRELEQLIGDAQTKYIMGKIDDVGWQTEIANWRKNGGDQMIKEYEASYAKMKK
jgi:putative aldouronate transport system substrate-binding protein